MNNYYEEMKVSETTRIANNIVSEYKSGNSNLADDIQDLAISNDIYVKIEAGDGSILFSPNLASKFPLYLYDMEIANLKVKLKNSDFDRAIVISPDRQNNTKTLFYACYLDDTTNQKVILYIFSPLYPVQSTISILRTQLIYITLISLLLALVLATYLARKISKPIRKITASAAEMGKGNYDIMFSGGRYSEITELADTLNTTSYQLQQIDLYQKDLIANVSHDLRTPLTMIRSYAELIHDISGDNPKKRDSHLQVIMDEADRLNTLVNDMLNISKMQSHKITLEKNDFDITTVAQNLINSYGILKEKESYIFKYNKPKSIIVFGDEAKINQVLSNLITNAVKYCGLDKTVIINIKKIGRKMRCEITDHGAGISQEEIPHIWERYYQSSTHHVRSTEGSGLGLSIVKEILTLHKSEFGVISKIGKGSTFWFEMDITKNK